MQNQETQSQPITQAQPQPTIATPPAKNDDDKPSRKTVIVCVIIRILSFLATAGSAAAFILYRYAKSFNMFRIDISIPVTISIVAIFLGAAAIISSVASNSKKIVLLLSIIFMAAPIVLLLIV